MYFKTMALTLFSSPWCTFRGSTMLHYLYQSQCDPQMSHRFRRFRNTRYLLYGFIALDVLRIIALGYHHSRGGQVVDQQLFNPLFTVSMTEFAFLNGKTFIAVAISLGTFALAIDYLLCFQLDDFLLRLVHQLMIDNADRLLALNRRQLGELMPCHCTRPNEVLRQYFRLVRRIWHSSTLQFKDSHIDHLPDLSAQLRARLVVYSAAIDWLFAVLCALFALSLCHLETSLMLRAYHRLPSYEQLLFLLDLTFILYWAWSTVRNGFLVTHIALLFSFLTASHMSQLTTSLRHAACQRQLVMFRYRFLSLFYREYRQLKYIAEYADRLLYSDLFGVIFLTINALSIIMLGNLLFKRLSLLEQLVMGLVFLLQTCLPLQCCGALICWAQSLHSAENELFRVQHRLESAPGDALYKRLMLTTAKVKLMTFYEQICTRSRFRFSVGPLGGISKRSLYEFCFAYSSMVMYVSKMIRKSRL